jgi:hypothetical protein
MSGIAAGEVHRIDAQETAIDTVSCSPMCCRRPAGLRHSALKQRMSTDSIRPIQPTHAQERHSVSVSTAISPSETLWHVRILNV